ncbi:MAG: hypothetical protein Q9190_004653 [Brigantiaea leucoxantha]
MPMAPLAELSTNRLPRSTANGETASLAKSLPQSLRSGSNTGFLEAPSSIQSMLKNTTELGDLGQFTVKPARIPLPGSNTIPRSRSRKYRQLGEPYQRHHRTHYKGRFPEHDKYVEAGKFYGRYQPPYLAYSADSQSQDQRSDSFTQSSYNTHGLSIHPTMLDIHSQSLVHLRLRSPLPSRFRHLGYYPYSPVSSEMSRSDISLHVVAHRAASNRTASPLSINNIRKARFEEKRSFDWPDPLSQQRPSPLGRNNDPNTPALSNTYSSSEPKSELHDLGFSSNSSKKETLLSSKPVFYDYSEAFEKETFSQTARKASVFPIQGADRNDNSQTQHVSEAQTEKSDVELSTLSSVTIAKASEQTHDEMKRTSSQMLTSKFQDESETIGPEKQVFSVSAKLNSNIGSQREDFESEKNDSPTRQTPVVSGESATKRNLSTYRMATPTRPLAAFDPGPKLVRSASHRMPLSSSSGGSTHSTNSSSQVDHLHTPSPIQIPDAVYQSYPKAVSFSQLDIIQQKPNQVEAQQRSVSFDTRARPQMTQIVAPVPNRSTSSRQLKDKFSRIFSFSDDPDKRDAVFQPSPNGKPQSTIQQYLRDKKRDPPGIRHTISDQHKELLDSATPALEDTNEKEKYIHFLELNVSSCLHPHDENPAVVANSSSQGLPPREPSARRGFERDLASPLPQGSNFLISQNGKNCEQSYASCLQTMKELPPLPNHSTALNPSPFDRKTREVPCSLDPMLSKEDETPLAEDWRPEVPAKSNSLESVVSRRRIATTKFGVRLGSDQDSMTSSLNSRPWNLDASYPWVNTPPKLEVKLPQSCNDTGQATGKAPRFSLKTHRASLSASGAKLTKPRPLNISVAQPQARGSQTSPRQMRFEDPFGQISSIPPSIKLVPPSPGLAIEAQSFFSDDSSQSQRKGTLRKRLSHIKSIASRATSFDDVRGMDRGLISSALGRSRASRRSSRQSLTPSEQRSQIRERRWKIATKLKSWLQRGEEKLRIWREKLLLRSGKC